MEQYCLRWDKHQPNFISAFSNLLSCEALVDVTLAAEDKYLQAHKVVLSACSSYFQTLFTVNPCQHPIVILKDVQFTDLKVMIDFIYNGEVNVTQEQLPNFLKTGELLKIKGVSEIAFDQLVSKDDDMFDQPDLLTPSDTNWSSENESRPTPCPLSPLRRRKRLRKSSTGSRSNSPERPPDEKPSPDPETFTCSMEESYIKLEADNCVSDESCDSEIIFDSSCEIFKEEITDAIGLRVPKNETGACVTNSRESTLMEFPGPSTPSQEQEEAPTKFIALNIQNYNSLCEKSRRQYEIVYKRLKEWCRKNDENEITETVLLTYFSEKSIDRKSASLWSEYSMMKASLAVKDNTDIRKYTKLTAFLKEKAIGYRPKKSKVLTRDQFYGFLTKAPDETFLLMKVVAIIGIAGACSRDELQSMTVDDLEDVGSVLIIKIPRSKTNRPRSFVVNGKEDDLNMIEIYRKYAALRPPHTKHNRLFVQYRNGKCSVQVVGVNSFGKIPSEIAKHLGLPNPTHYTGHCFRRSSSALFAHTGADVFSLKRPAYWMDVTNSSDELNK